MTFLPPLLAPPGPGFDPLNIQITFGWCGFYGTAMWDRMYKFIRIGLGVVSIRLMWFGSSGFFVPRGTQVKGL